MMDSLLSIAMNTVHEAHGQLSMHGTVHKLSMHGQFHVHYLTFALRVFSRMRMFSVKPIRIPYTLEQKPHIHFLPCSNTFWLVFR